MLYNKVQLLYDTRSQKQIQKFDFLLTFNKNNSVIVNFINDS